MRSTNIILFLVALNGAALIFSAILGPAIGVSVTVGGDSAIDEASEATSQYQNISRGGVDEFVAATFSTADFFGQIGALLFAGPEMLRNLGVPGVIITSFEIIVSFVFAIDLAQIISGRVLS